MNLRDRVLQSVAETPAPTRQNQRVRTWLVGSFFVASIIASAVAGHRGGRSVAYLALALGAHALAIVASTWWIAAPGGALGRARPMVRASAAAALVLLVLGALGAGALAPARVTTTAMHLGCLEMDLALGAVFFFAAAFGLRPFDPVAPRATAGALGMLGLSWAALAMAMHCSLGDPFHVLATHVLPGLGFVLAGALVGPRWFGARTIGAK
jgi:hypothetical protein